jgi:uncharacterized protein with ParB-like and HNH nuclease domain
MSFSINNMSIDNLLGYIKNGAVALPEIQRPYVWSNIKVRDLIDSLYKEYPIGYLILWSNPNIKAKDGTLTGGKKIIIDGQQRITALTAAILGYEIVDSSYQKRRIKIAFNPIEDGGKFEVQSPAIVKDKRWIDDISKIFLPDFSSYDFVNKFVKGIPEINPNELSETIQKLRNIVKIPLGAIELNETIDIETVTDIFIRINSQGKPLSQSDFAMSKIASDSKFGGNLLRKAIDYFCHLAVAPHDFNDIYNNDKEFAESMYAKKISWLKDDTEIVYDPDYDDVLRVSFMYKFGRAKISDLVSLLSGRNFETREYLEEIAEESFKKLSDGFLAFANRFHFDQFMLTIKSIGFKHPNLITSKSAIDFAYQLFLRLNDSSMDKAAIKRYTQKWFVLSVLTSRYSGSAETQLDRDIRTIDEKGFVAYFEEVEKSVLSDTYWDVTLIQSLETTSINNPSFKTFLAAQIFFSDVSLLSNTSKVEDLILNVGDIHHIFPKSYLKKNGIDARKHYNQIANYTYLDTQVNIQIGDKAPNVYMPKALEQCNTKEIVMGNILDKDTLYKNFEQNCIPLSILESNVNDYNDFLVQRRILIAKKLRAYYEAI